MSRNFILVFGAICWTVAIADAAWRLSTGDVFVPAMMLLAFVLWTTLRLRHFRRMPVEA
jgi:hypothetical protein